MDSFSTLWTDFDDEIYYDLDYDEEFEDEMEDEDDWVDDEIVFPDDVCIMCHKPEDKCDCWDYE